MIGCTHQVQESRYDYSKLQYVWSGAVTDSSARINFKLSQGAELEKIELSLDNNSWYGAITDSQYFDVAHGTGAFWLDSLQPGTPYFYRVTSVNGVSQQGRFSTFPSGPSSFSFAIGSCSQTGSNRVIYKTILDKQPLFFMNTGDFHYENIDTKCDSKYQQAFFNNLSQPNQSTLYRHLPFAYMWDDHDFGPNNSDSRAPCREQAISNYKKLVPHYPTAFDQVSDPISQVFEIGRVKFLLTDLRSGKVSPTYDECQRQNTGSNFGSKRHLSWFKEELLAAKADGQFVFWVSGIPWINHQGGPNYECDEDDDWGGFPEERGNIANFIKSNEIKLCMLSGDAHMLAIDDGANSDYADGGGAGFPVFHAAALDRKGSYKGGPYSHGHSSGPGQFGWVDVQDEGDESIKIQFVGFNEKGEVVRNERSEEIRYEFEVKL
ncbi:MAG: alkaline phosphatase D family protein [Cyclobacteriaceae bacterium]|nr:alkaline phosphatase D family protein [Cyclobacteriaceae bacterium HetDA_MAG_MS6]